MARNYSNITVETTLVSSIGNSDTLIDVADDTGFPAQFPFTLILDFQASTVEVVNVTGTAGASYAVERGQDGTAAQSHTAGAVVVHGVTARDLQEPQDHIDASTNVHGVGAVASVVGTDTTQTLTNKTIAFSSNTLTDVASTNTSQTLTNKTIAASNNTLTLSLNDLSDVTTSGASDGDVLVLNSGTWQPAADPRPGQLVAKVRRTTAQSVASFTETAIAFDSEDLDLLGAWSAGNPTRFTPSLAGWYEFTGKVSFAASTDGTYRAIGWKKNGSSIEGGWAQYVTNATISSWEVNIPAPTIAILLNGSTDYVEMIVAQATIGSLSTSSLTQFQPFMCVKYVGPA